VADPLMEQIRILIAEDEGLLRGTLAELLGREDGLAVVAACANGRDALIDALHHLPDVVLTDLRMPRMDGIELTRELKEKLPQTAIVVLTAFDDDEHLFAAIKAGAIGYVLKDASMPQIVEALRAARRGEGFLSPGLVTRVLDEFNRTDRIVRGQREIFAQLTRRETEVLELLAGGMSNRQIAQRLFLSDKTVRNHISVILGKLHANDRTEAALIAARHGLGPPPQPPTPATEPQ
jgi:DNA-binding NarL/FixJ family response regulator